jgi:hypothetical protein
MQARSAKPIFTVCQTTAAIELKVGLSDHPGSRVICSTMSYDMAKRMGQLSSRMASLPFIDHTITPKAGN